MPRGRTRFGLVAVGVGLLAVVGTVAAIPIEGTLSPSAALSAQGRFYFEGDDPGSLAAAWSPSPTPEPPRIQGARLTLLIQESRWQTIAGAPPAAGTPAKAGGPGSLFYDFRQYELLEPVVHIVSSEASARWVLTATNEGTLHGELGPAATCRVVAGTPRPVYALEDASIPVPTVAWIPSADTVMHTTCEATSLSLRGPMRLVVSGSALTASYVDSLTHLPARLSLKTGLWASAASPGRVDNSFVLATIVAGPGTEAVDLPVGGAFALQAPAARVDGSIHVPKGQARIRWGEEPALDPRAALAPEGTFRVSAVGDSIAFRGQASRIIRDAAWGAGLLAVAALVWKLGVPPVQFLFTRIAENEVLRHRRRRAILDVVAQHGGIGSTEVANLLGIPRRSVEYHIGVLARQGMLARRRFGRRTAVYLVGAQPPEMQARLHVLRQRSTRAIMDALDSAGTLSQRDLVARVRLSQSRVSTILARLKELGAIESERRGRIIWYRTAARTA